MTNGQENRRSFRVNESVYIRYEVLTDTEFEEGLERRKLKLGINDDAQALLVDIEARLSESMYLLNAESDQTGKCITLLNDKLNVVIQQLPGLRKAKSDLAQQPPQHCDISADGMVFAAESPFSVGKKLYLQFLLTSDNRFVETFCRVVRQTEPPAGNDAQMLPHGVAVEFHGMKPALREILIQHMFSRESETLRMRRLQIDGRRF
jgi:hypothetical protein